MWRRWPLAIVLFTFAVGAWASGHGQAAQLPEQNSSTPSHTEPNGTAQSSFLIARRELQDPLFQQTVVLMLPLVDKNIVVGLIVNKPTHVKLQELFPKIETNKNSNKVAYFGGPVGLQTAGALFRASKALKPAFQVSGDVYVTFDRALIERIMKKPKQVSEVRLFVGRSQWTPNQLAGEFKRGSWYGEKEENSVIFRPESTGVWLELIGTLEPGSVAELQGTGAMPVSQGIAREHSSVYLPGS